jgi:perosamine synthetase
MKKKNYFTHEKYSMAGPLIDESDIKELDKMMRVGWYGKKKYIYVEKFEKIFAAYHNRKYAIMTANCTSSIHVALKSINIKKNDEIIVPDITWISTASPIKQLNAKIVFCDIDPDNWCIDPNKVEKLINKRTKAIIAVNLYGNMPDMKKLEKICKKNNIFLFEDAAEALGSIQKNIKAGKFGFASFFSFHRTKTITTGEGGMILTDNKKLYNNCKFYRDNGRDFIEPYWCNDSFIKFMPSNIQGCLGYSQFKKIKKILAKKRKILNLYYYHLKDLKFIQLNNLEKNFVNGAWTVAITWNKKYKINSEYIINELKKKGLPTRPFFFPLSSMKTFSAKNLKNINKISYEVSKKGLCLPSGITISESEIKYYCSEIKKLFSRNLSNL